MEDCTFRPMTNESAAPKRNLQQFLDDQQRHEEVKVLKHTLIVEEENREDGELIYHPQINQKSEEMTRDKREGHVYDRLYDISKEKMQKQVRQMMENE